MSMKLLSLTLTLTACIGLATTGCGTRDPGLELNEIANDPRYHPDPSTTFSVGWNKILIRSSFETTSLSGTGHIITTRNACGFEKATTLEAPYWNGLAKKINAVAKEDPSAPENCFDFPETGRRTPDTVDIVLDRGVVKRIFSQRDGKMCTTVQNPQAAQDLIKEMLEIMYRADRIDCREGNIPT